MQFRLLGPLEVECGGHLLDLDGSRERTVLALLLLFTNEVISTDTMITWLWGEEPPPTARHTVETYVSRLRKALATGGDECSIETTAGGYLLRIDPGSLDLRRFEWLCEEGRAALAAGEADRAAEKLDAALALWRGDSMTDPAFEPLAQLVAIHSEERLAATEARFEAGLLRGEQATLIGDLQYFVERHPEREKALSLLMHALYRDGRQQEALDVYRQARSRCIDELGIEPSRELRNLQEAILRQDPTLDEPAWALLGYSGRRGFRAEIDVVLAADDQPASG